ncbi:MAG: sigma-70 family RNA polymerase sigma factor [Verrucomicrobia bacterium]|nr:sigma-70 family RNA polymerase sigma factor [Verrucomicrobiota bacterium]
MDEEKQKRTFDDWLAQHRGLIFKVVRAYAFTPTDQDDLFQEIATQIWNSIPQFRGNSAVTTAQLSRAVWRAIKIPPGPTTRKGSGEFREVGRPWGRGGTSVSSGLQLLSTRLRGPLDGLR